MNAIHKGKIERGYIVCTEVRNHLVLVDRILLPGRLCVWLRRNHLGGKDILLEEAWLDELLQVSSESQTVDGLVPLTVVVRAVLL